MAFQRRAPPALSEASFTLAYKSSSGAGAVLLTDPPVTHEQAQHESLFLNWMSQNAGKLLAHRSFGKMVKEYGIWVITKTYSVKRCALTVLTSEGSEVRVSFGGRASNAVALTPTASWWNGASSDSSWSIYSDVYSTRPIIKQELSELVLTCAVGCSCGSFYERHRVSP